MSTGPRSQCDACVHLRPKTDLDDPMTCTAFPAGIPDVVFGNGVDHRRPVAGDGGITFAARPGDGFPAWALAPGLWGIA